MTERYDVAAIRAAHPIAETVRGAGIALRRSGGRLSGRCPFHADRDPSLVVYPQTASYFCFGCNVGGDVIDFLCRLHHRSFRETAALLSAGIATSLPSNVVQFRAQRAAPSMTTEEAAVVESAVEHYGRALAKYPDVRAYLSNRGIPLETAQRLRLGYAAGGLARWLSNGGLSLESAEQLGLLARNREPFTGRIVVPDLDAGGRARWLTGRALDERTPRYLNLRAPSPLLGLTQARLVGVNAVVVVEGPFDWLTARSWGIPAAALLGTHVSRAVLRGLQHFQRCYVAFDADGAGRRAASALARELGPRAALVALPPGVHDLNELGQQREGRGLFLRSLRASRARMEESWQTARADRRDRAA